MGTKGYRVRFSVYYGAIVLGALFPNHAKAGKISVAQDACNSQAKAAFQKKAVEVAMASIVSDLSDMEVADARAGLRRQLESAQAHCLRIARASSAVGSATF